MFFYKNLNRLKKKKKKNRYITDDLEISSDDSDEEQIKIKYRDNVFFRKSNFDKAFFNGAILIISFSESISKNVFFEGKILKNTKY